MIREQQDECFEFIATIEREMYYNNDWGTYKFVTTTPLEGSRPGRGFKGEDTYTCTLTGNMQRLDLGKNYKVTATHEFHKRYGHNFNPISVTGLKPKTEDEQIKFLESIFTITQAKTIIKQYPNVVQDVIDGKDNVDVKKLKGINEDKWIELKQKIVDNFIISDVLALFSPLGVSLNMIQKICETEQNPELLKQKMIENPYILTKIKGVGFKRADVIAMKLNPNLASSRYRADSYINYYLTQEGDENGHSWVRISDLKENVVNNIPECVDVIEDIINEQRDRSTYLKVNGKTIGLKKRYSNERFVWDKLYDINNTPSLKVVKEEFIDQGIIASNSFQGFEYDDEQVKIIKDVVTIGGVQVITGKAGVGKTAISRGVLNVYKKAGFTILTCALSARAGIVIKESTGFSSSTIHKMLGANGSGFFYRDTEPLGVDVLMIDEMSMVNIDIIASVLESLKPTTTLLLVGDGKQLPPIGYGNALNDIIDSNIPDLCHVNYLKTIYRQAMDSGIIKDANIIRENQYPFERILPSIVSGKNKDMVYKFFDDNQMIHNMALKVYLKAIESDGIESAVIICPRKENCLNSTETFNNEIQKYLFGAEVPSFTYGMDKSQKEFKVGAKVMQFKNDYSIGVMNGEVGYVTRVDNVNKCLYINFEGKEVKYQVGGDDDNKRKKKEEERVGDIRQVMLSYANTCHKLQGSACDTVVGVLDTSHYVLLDSTLLYTLITRARKRCMLISQPTAFQQCIRTSHSISRNTYMSLFKVRSNEPPQIPYSPEELSGEEEEQEIEDWNDEEDWIEEITKDMLPF